MELRVVDLSGESLKGIGHLLTPEQWELPGKGKEYTYTDIDANLGLPSPCSAGVLVSVLAPHGPCQAGTSPAHPGGVDRAGRRSGILRRAAAGRLERWACRDHRRAVLRRPGPYPGNGRLAMDSLPRW
jgi:hypothetical protein